MNRCPGGLFVPLGFPHRATRDIIWKGLRIPAGATVYGCHWSISRDANAFPDPENFDPQRWVEPCGRICPDLKSFPFGFGRRVCPGQYLASDSILITLASLFWAFRILEPNDAPIDRWDAGHLEEIVGQS
ncbi:cytochrome P450 [Suillus discolor]|uniref:Cytochrome P450 n=1 Tax=Suillus discolor TaxID=1912936 RepID=A0A9P7EZC1_9AGAM|nr:cytochrome P450 [Suillus discolor]KAG2099588.1 cytochrome P450 [Suillus discolor]